MKKAKILLTVAMVLLLSFILTACNSSKSYSFNVETGDKIEVKLDTSDGYKLKQDNGTFTVESKDGELLTQGFFQLPDRVKELFNNLNGAEGVKIIDQTDNTIFYEYTEGSKTVWNYILKFDDESAGIGLTNSVSEESAKTVISLLTFNLANHIDTRRDNN